MIKFHALTSALLLLNSIPPGLAADEGDRRVAELKWAKGVATDFLDSAFNGNLVQAEGLLDSSLKRSFARDGDKRVGEWLNNSIAIQGFRAPVIQSEDIAPDLDEASFKGTFQSGKKAFQFSLRVVKDKEGGKWRVSYFHFVEQHDEKK